MPLKGYETVILTWKHIIFTYKVWIILTDVNPCGKSITFTAHDICLDGSEVYFILWQRLTHAYWLPPLEIPVNHTTFYFGFGNHDTGLVQRPIYVLPWQRQVCVTIAMEATTTEVFSIVMSLRRNGNNFFYEVLLHFLVVLFLLLW